MDRMVRERLREFHISTKVLLGLLFLIAAFAFVRMVLMLFGVRTASYDTTAKAEATAQVETMFQTALPGAGKMAKMDTMMTYALTGRIVSSQVLQGEDGWLFYKTTTDGDPIADYTGTNAYSEEEMAAILSQLLEVKEQLRQNKQMLIVFLPPNKESIYAQYMPDQYVQAAETRTDQLANYLSDGGIRVVNPKETLLSYRDDYQLYYKYDTHWNLLGSYLGICDLMESMEVEMTPLEQCEIEERMLADQDYSEASDDLAMLIGLRDLFFTDDTDPRVKGTFVSFQNQVKDVNGLPYSVIINPNAHHTGKVLLLGDSFSSYMLSPLCTEFDSVAYGSIETEQGAEILADYAPDYVILEYVERYSEYLNEVGSLFADEHTGS